MKDFSSNANSDVVFFDGVCNLCNAFVDFAIRRNDDLLFAPLQGKTASRRLPPDRIRDLPSIVLLESGYVFTESSAALKIIARLRGVYRMAGVFLLIPKFARDFIYRFIARRRYALFGRRETCRCPTPEERSRFLD